MNRSLLKDILRETRKQLSQFISLALILTLGIGFFIGIRVTGADMRLTADEYYENNSLMDLRVISTLGLDDDCLQSLQEIPEIDRVYPDYALDSNARLDGRDFIVRSMALPEEQDAVNQPLLATGRMPESPGECLIDDMYARTDKVELGQTVELFPEDDGALSRTAFTVVGTAKSPMYITLDRGYTSIGSGKLSAFLYIDRDVFQLDYYTDAYITLKNTAGLSGYSPEYTDAVKAVQEKVEGLTGTISQLRLEKIKQPYETEYKENKEKFEQERADVQQQLADAKAELDQAEQQLRDGWSEWWAGAQEAFDRLDMEQPERNAPQAALAALEKKLREVEDGLPALEGGISELKASLQELETGQADYEEGQKKYQASKEEAKRELAASKEKLDNSKKELEEGEAALSNGVSQLYAMAGLKPPQGLTPEEALARAQQDLGPFAAQSPVLEKALEELEAQGVALAAGRQAYEAGVKEYEAGKAKAEQELANAAKELDAAARELEAGRAAWLDGAQAAAEELGITISQTEPSAVVAALEAGAADIKEGQNSLQTGISKLKSALKDLESGQAEYNDGLAAYEESKKKADRELTDGAAKLEDAREKLDQMDSPELYVRTRSDNPGYDNYDQDSQRIEAIGQVFPLIFFLVAALVCLSSITRMVEEHRTEMGTLKALGYTQHATAIKYMSFALGASLIGLLLGCIIGYNFLPVLIYNAYRTLYSTPDLIHPFSLSVLILPAALALLCTTLTAYAACKLALRSVPASLMRPPAPKAGKRVILEHVPFIWTHLSFLKKVTTRNLLRNKTRFWMSVLGIAGCMGLLITGFGLNHSIMSIVPTQFDEISQYDLQIGFSGSEQEKQTLSALLDSRDDVTGHLAFYSKSAAASAHGANHDANVTVLPANAKPDGFFSLKDRNSGDPVPLTDDGAVIDEKLAILLNLNTGDELELFNSSEGIACKVKVAGIVENYVYHYVFMTENYAQSVMAMDFSANLMYVNTPNETDAAGTDRLAEELLRQKGVTAVIRASDIRGMFDDMMGNFKVVIAIIVLAAGALALVVLYNLSIINISERQREVATLKVLGFFDRETWAYIYRENIVLMLIGIVFGGFFGWILHGFVVRTAEIDMVMFVRQLDTLSIVLSMIMTVVYTALINIMVYFKLKRINMVEALKSVE